MRVLTGFLLIVLLLAGLVAAPGISVAAPDCADPPAVSMPMMDHGAVMDHARERPGSSGPMKHDLQGMLACSAWCAGAFLGALPAAPEFAAAMKPTHERPVRHSPLADLPPRPPLEPPITLLL